MINLLIANTNLKNLRDYTNLVLQNVSQSRIAYMATDAKEAFEALIYDNKINMIIIGADLSICEVNKLLCRISFLKKEIFKKSIIIITNDMNAHKNLIKNEHLYTIIEKKDVEKVLIPTILKYIEITYPDSVEILDKNKIKFELKNIGYNLSHIGTQYLVDVLYLIRSKNCSPYNLSESVYPLVSQKHDKSVNNIKSNITLATESLYRNTNNMNLQNYFNLVGNIRPTAKMIVYTILQRLRED